MKELLCITLFLFFILYTTYTVIKEVATVHDNVYKIVLDMNEIHDINKGK